MSERASHYSEKSSSYLRKTNKSQMEKCRRARINDCLNELKALVLEAMKRDTSRYSKLEKADILEMTVKHLRTVQRQQMAVAVSRDPTVVNRYRAGFNECAQEVTRYLGSIDGVNSEVKCRVMGHLSNIVQNANQTPPVQKTVQAINPQPIQIQIPQMPAPAVMNSFGQATCQMPQTMASQQTVAILQSPQNLVQSPGDHQFQTMDGTIQVVPSHLATGQFAYIIPTNVSNGSTDTKLTSHVIPLYSSRPTDGSMLTARVKADVQTPLLVRTSFIQPAADITSPMCAMDAPAGNPQIPRQRAHSASSSVVPSVAGKIVPNSTNVAVPRDNAPTDDFMWRPW